MKEESGSPGLVISVSVDGKIVWNEGFGYADVENDVPCTPNTVMRIASISKPLTATATSKNLIVIYQFFRPCMFCRMEAQSIHAFLR